MTSSTHKVAGKPVRADARRNIARVLEAAETAFATQGLGAPIDEIANMAGVGVGTIYRHFPTKEALAEAVVGERLEMLVERAHELAASRSPGDALFAYLSELVEHAADKRDLLEQMAREGIHGERLSGAKRSIEQAVAGMIKRAQAAGDVRKDISASELSSLLMGTCAAACQRQSAESARRLLTVLHDGLRPRGP